MNDHIQGGGATSNNYTLFAWPDGDAGWILATAVLCLSIGGCNYLSGKGMESKEKHEKVEAQK